MKTIQQVRRDMEQAFWTHHVDSPDCLLISIKQIREWHAVIDAICKITEPDTSNAARPGLSGDGDTTC